MIVDLIRALLAAIAVGVLPGYFWSRCLFSSPDFAVRLALSVAFSITLVPAVALIPARILGLGVTFPVTVFSAIVVLAAGFAAYLRFGPSKEPDGPLAPPPTPLGVPALVLVLLALGLALAAPLGFVSLGWEVAFAIALLLLLAAAVHAIEARRGTPQEPLAKPLAEPSAETAGRWRVVTRVMLVVVLGLVLGRAYVGPVYFDWPFVRGVDHYSHAVMANLMRSDGSVESYLVYPPGFHTMTAMVSNLSGLDPLEIFPVLGPGLLVLPPLALYVLASRLWSEWHGVVAAGLSGLLVGGSYHYFNDAMYPNMVASQFLLVLTLAALFRLYRSPSVRAGLALALLGSAVVLYHPVASFYLALLLALSSVPLLPYLLLRERKIGLALLSSFTLMGVLAVIYAWDTYDLGQAASSLLSGTSETGRGGEAVTMAVGTQMPFELGSLLTTVSLPVLLFGVLGALLLVTGSERGTSVAYALARINVLIWCLILFIGSRTPLSGFPQRFERDLGMPLSLLAAFALVALLSSVSLRQRLVFIRQPLAIIAAYLAVVLALFQVGTNFDKEAAPSFRLVMSVDIAAAGEWLEEHNEGGNIMVSPHRNQVPARMMLAMGDYSALQSFDAGQLDPPRDLPPSGPGPLEDVLRVVNHPESERTRQLLEKHDVRYIVLYKSMPDRKIQGYWQRFEARPDLYRSVFDNHDVEIFQGR